jgi:mannan endo-1,4-beta-mannosidase
MSLVKLVAIGAAVLVAIAVIVAATRHYKSAAGPPTPAPVILPTTPDSYLGVYRKGVPHTYARVSQLTASTGVRPNVVMYYSGWLEPFQTKFALTANGHGAVPMVQIEPKNKQSIIKLSAITSGTYDTYLREFASDVRVYGHAVIIGFGHEMNGYWYSWGTRHHNTPAEFVAAWRHIVNIFRSVGTTNVTWLWTVNIIDLKSGIPSPDRWWPGRQYVTWVGIDGYYYKPSWAFAPLFGPTIKAIRAVTRDPILISETGASSQAGKAAKIADVFAGVRAYGLLGFVWYDAMGVQDWRIDTPAAVAALRRGAQAYKRAAA